MVYQRGGQRRGRYSQREGGDQTLTGGPGHDVLEGFGGGGMVFCDTAAGLDGNVIRGMEAGGTSVVTDLLAGAVLDYDAGSGRLGVSDGVRKASIVLDGHYDAAGFHLPGDGSGGVQIGYMRL